MRNIKEYVKNIIDKFSYKHEFKIMKLHLNLLYQFAPNDMDELITREKTMSQGMQTMLTSTDPKQLIKFMSTKTKEEQQKIFVIWIKTFELSFIHYNYMNKFINNDKPLILMQKGELDTFEFLKYLHDNNIFSFEEIKPIIQKNKGNYENAFVHDLEKMNTYFERQEILNIIDPETPTAKTPKLL